MVIGYINWQKIYWGIWVDVGSFGQNFLNILICFVVWEWLNLPLEENDKKEENYFENQKFNFYWWSHSWGFHLFKANMVSHLRQSISQFYQQLLHYPLRRSLSIFTNVFKPREGFPRSPQIGFKKQKLWEVICDSLKLKS